MQPRGQRGAIGHPHRDLVARRQEAVIDNPQHRSALEKDHVALGVEIVAERLAGNDEQRAVFQPRNQIVTQHRRVVAREHGDRDMRGRETATAIGDGVGEPGRAVIIRGRAEFDHSGSVDPRLAVLGEARDAAQHQGIAVLVGIVGQQRCRIDDQQQVFQRPQSAIVVRLGRVVERADFELVNQRRGGATRIDHIVFEPGHAQRGRGKADRPGGLVERDEAVVGGIVVRAGVQPDERKAIAFDVIGIGHELGDGDRRGLLKADTANGVGGTGRVVDRRDVDLDPRLGNRAAGILQGVDEARRTEIVGAELQFDILAI